MKGLLLKDWYQARAYMKTMFLTVIVVMGIYLFGAKDSADFMVNYAALFCGIVPVSLLSYDQASGWIEYSAALPLSKKQLVGAKYLIGLICAGAAVILSGIALLVVRLRSGAAGDTYGGIQLVSSVAVVLLMNGLLLPLVYRFGMEKARLFYIAMFAVGGVLIGGSTVLMDEIQNMNFSGTAPAGLAVGGVVLAVLALYVLSWRLSVAWYGKYKK